MKNLHLTLVVCLLITQSLFAQEKKIANLSQAWTGYIELENSSLSKHILNDIPGTVIALIPSKGGKYTYKLLGKKVLKDSLTLPTVKLEPQILTKGFSKKDVTVGVSYLSYISASMDSNSEVNLTITETSHSAIVDNQIDWTKYDKRVIQFKNANGNKANGVIFGVVKVASVISIEYQMFKKVNRAAQISGFGFAGNSNYLTQNGIESNSYKVGVDIVYSDEALGQLASVANLSPIIQKIPIKTSPVNNDPDAPEMIVRQDPKSLIPFLIESKQYEGELNDE